MDVKNKIEEELKVFKCMVISPQINETKIFQILSGKKSKVKPQSKNYFSHHINHNALGTSRASSLLSEL